MPTLILYKTMTPPAGADLTVEVRATPPANVEPLTPLLRQDGVRLARALRQALPPATLD